MEEIVFSKPSRLRTFWKFLNSPLGLLAISSILITGVGSLYTRYQEDSAKEIERNRQLSDKEKEEAKLFSIKEIERQQQIEKLDLEIAFRYSVILQRLSGITSDSSATAVEIARATSEAVENLQPPHLGPKLERDRDYRDLWFFQDYRDLGILGVYAELYQKLKGKEKEDFSRIISRILLDSFKTEELANPRSVAIKIQRSLIDKRWRTGNKFGYLDCSPPKTDDEKYNPFC